MPYAFVAGPTDLAEALGKERSLAQLNKLIISNRRFADGRRLAGEMLLGANFRALLEDFGLLIQLPETAGLNMYAFSEKAFGILDEYIQAFEDMERAFAESA